MSIFGFQSMSQSRRKAKRHEIPGDQRIDVQIFRNGCGSDCTDNNEIVAAEIVDISLTGLKVESATAFEFEEKILLSIRRTSSEKPIEIPAQVRWVQPVGKSKKESAVWAAGCLLRDSLPADYIDEISDSGMLDRRISPRIRIEKEATARWEMSQDDFVVQIQNISSNGIGIVVPKDCDVGKRIRIEIDKGTSEHFFLTGKTIRHNPVDDGIFVGCEIAPGSANSLSKYAQESLSLMRESPRTYKKLVVSGLSLLLLIIARQVFF